MSLSPLPKKGSFSNLLSFFPGHRRTISSKTLKKTPSKSSDFEDEQKSDIEKTAKLEISLKKANEELHQLKLKNSYLRKKILTLQSKSTKTLGENYLEMNQNIKNIYKIQNESIKLIDFLFKAIEKAFNFSPNWSIDGNFEIELIENFQDFQNKTQINTSSYIQKIMGWRHNFINDLISPVDSRKNAAESPIKNSRSVSSIIASSIKVYAVGLQDYFNSSPLHLQFRKGEIIEITQVKGDICEGKIGNRQGVFPEKTVKIV